MPRICGQRGPYQKKHTLICAWCGERFEAVVVTASTCGITCRTHLHRYRKRTGLEPLEPPGKVTCSEALEVLFCELLARERVRRQDIAFADAEQGARIFKTAMASSRKGK